MSDLDTRIRALVAEVVDDPPAAPPFPFPAPSPRGYGPTRGWAVAATAFAVTVLLGAVIYILAQQDSRGPVVTPPPPPTSGAPPTTEAVITQADVETVISTLSQRVGAGDLERVLDLFHPEGLCLLPNGVDSCADMFGFFIAADGQLVLGDCRNPAGENWTCSGHVHTSIHDALDISVEQLASMPNLTAGLAFDQGLITRFTVNDPFTGDPSLDDELWSFLIDRGADYVDGNGVPLFEADIVPAFLDDASDFAATR